MVFFSLKDSTRVTLSESIFPYYDAGLHLNFSYVGKLFSLSITKTKFNSSLVALVPRTMPDIKQVLRITVLNFFQ